jgi:hypothetical protein
MKFTWSRHRFHRVLLQPVHTATLSQSAELRYDRREYAAGRVTNGLDTAIHIARRAGMPLKVAARMPLPFRDDRKSARTGTAGSA